MALRILWHSVVPWAPSAFGGQTRSMVRSLVAAGHRVVCSADAGLAGEVAWEGLRVVASPAEVDGALQSWAAPLVEAGELDLVITLVDGFRLRDRPLPGVPTVSWLPVHTDPAEDAVVRAARRPGVTPLGVSGFGGRALSAALGRTVHWIPHGIDRTTFRPLVTGDRAASRAEARAQLGWDPDRFLVGFVGTNVQPLHNRKGLPELFAAVGRLAAEHSDVALHVHADRHGRWMGGDDLDRLAAATGADRAQLTFASDDAVRVGLPDAEVAVRLNAFDVLAAPSATEGFCLPLIEAQACGVPVIATDAAAAPENVRAGWLVRGQPRWQPAERRWWTSPSIAAIHEALVAARAQAGDAKVTAEQAAEAERFADGFDHHRLFAERWQPLLAGVDR